MLTDKKHIEAARNAFAAAVRLFAFSRTDAERMARAHIVDACAAAVRDLTGRTPSASEIGPLQS